MTVFAVQTEIAWQFQVRPSELDDTLIFSIDNEVLNVTIEFYLWKNSLDKYYVVALELRKKYCCEKALKQLIACPSCKASAVADWVHPLDLFFKQTWPALHKIMEEWTKDSLQTQLNMQILQSFFSTALNIYEIYEQQKHLRLAPTQNLFLTLQKCLPEATAILAS